MNEPQDEKPKRGPGRPRTRDSIWEPLNVPVEQLVQAVLRPAKRKQK